MECTAFERSADNDRNRLFTPPCQCPNCRPAPAVAADAAEHIWLNRQGRPVRHLVRDLDLNPAGRAALGGERPSARSDSSC